MIDRQDCIKSLEDIGRCLQTIIKTRYRKNVKLIYTKGKYKSVYISFYRSPYVCQFYVEDQHNRYMIYLLKNDKVVRKDTIKLNETVERFYQKICYFFQVVN